MATAAQQIILQHLEIDRGAAGARDNDDIIALHNNALRRTVAHQRAYNLAQAAFAAVAHHGIANLAAGGQTKTKWSMGIGGDTRLYNKTRARPTLGVAGYVLEVSAVDQFLYRLGHQHQRQAFLPCRPFVLCPIPCGIIAAQLSRQNLAAFGATSGQNFAASNSCHACTEAVAALADQFAWLICTLHSVSPCINN